MYVVFTIMAGFPMISFVDNLVHHPKLLLQLLTAHLATVAQTSTSTTFPYRELNLAIQLFIQLTLSSRPSSGTPSYKCQNVVLKGNAASLFGACATT
jgi:hypothetical protein